MKNRRWWCVWIVSACAAVCCGQDGKGAGAPPAVHGTAKPGVLKSRPLPPGQALSPSTHKRRLSAHAAQGRVAGMLPVSGVPAQPATVSYKNGELTIAANRSDLEKLLSAASYGNMTVDGLTRSVLVSGSYGPGKPREVLTQLLEGSSYSFLMVGGSPDGLPRELILTARSSVDAKTAAPEQQGAPVSGGAHEVSGAPLPGSAPAGGVEGGAGAEAADGESSEPLGPGAIAHVPPAEATDGSSENAASRMQQHLDKLQQLQASQSPPQ